MWELWKLGFVACVAVLVMLALHFCVMRCWKSHAGVMRNRYELVAGGELSNRGVAPCRMRTLALVEKTEPV